MVSLGCVKNLVDTEGVLGALAERGWLVAARARDADVVLINTCGFIADARDESLGVIEEITKLKDAGRLRGIVVMGCLVQRLGQELVERFPAVDSWVGLAAPDAVVQACRHALDKPLSLSVRGKGEGVAATPSVCLPDPAIRATDRGPRLRVTPKHYAYLRIAEGCDNRCGYCTIPSIRGPLRSRAEADVLREARELIADDARELILIAQDTTAYGTENGGEPRLPGLLRQLRTLDRLVWLRLLYTHPARITDDLIAVLAEGRPVLPYVDLPIQHASDRILERMGRRTTRDGLRSVIARLRERVPQIVLRTTIIVGFPGEEDSDFRQLLDFLKETRFERLGAFAYSPEAGTAAVEMNGKVPAEVKEERLAAVMELQQQIAAEQSAELIGREIDIVVDGRGNDGEWAGRTVRDAPDADGTIRFEQTNLEAGTFGRALITDAYGYDLTGSMMEQEAEEEAEEEERTG